MMVAVAAEERQGVGDLLLFWCQKLVQFIESRTSCPNSLEPELSRLFGASKALRQGGRRCAVLDVGAKQRDLALVGCAGGFDELPPSRLLSLGELDPGFGEGESRGMTGVGSFTHLLQMLSMSLVPSFFVMACSIAVLGLGQLGHRACRQGFGVGDWDGQSQRDSCEGQGQRAGFHSVSFLKEREGGGEFAQRWRRDITLFDKLWN